MSSPVPVPGRGTQKPIKVVNMPDPIPKTTHPPTSPFEDDTQSSNVATEGPEPQTTPPINQASNTLKPEAPDAGGTVKGKRPRRLSTAADLLREQLAPSPRRTTAASPAAAAPTTSLSKATASVKSLLGQVPGISYGTISDTHQSPEYERQYQKERLERDLEAGASSPLLTGASSFASTTPLLGSSDSPPSSLIASAPLYVHDESNVFHDILHSISRLCSCCGRDRKHHIPIPDTPLSQPSTRSSIGREPMNIPDIWHRDVIPSTHGSFLPLGHPNASRIPVIGGISARRPHQRSVSGVSANIGRFSTSAGDQWDARGWVGRSVLADPGQSSHSKTHAQPAKDRTPSGVPRRMTVAGPVGPGRYGFPFIAPRDLLVRNFDEEARIREEIEKETEEEERRLGQVPVRGLSVSPDDGFIGEFGSGHEWIESADPSSVDASALEMQLERSTSQGTIQKNDGDDKNKGKQAVLLNPTDATEDQGSPDKEPRLFYLSRHNSSDTVRRLANAAQKFDPFHSQWGSPKPKPFDTSSDLSGDRSDNSDDEKEKDDSDDGESRKKDNPDHEENNDELETSSGAEENVEDEDEKSDNEQDVEDKTKIAHGHDESVVGEEETAQGSESTEDDSKNDKNDSENLDDKEDEVKPQSKGEASKMPISILEEDTNVEQHDANSLDNTTSDSTAEEEETFVSAITDMDDTRVGTEGEVTMVETEEENTDVETEGDAGVETQGYASVDRDEGKIDVEIYGEGVSLIMENEETQNNQGPREDHDGTNFEQSIHEEGQDLGDDADVVDPSERNSEGKDHSTISLSDDPVEDEEKAKDKEMDQGKGATTQNEEGNDNNSVASSLDSTRRELDSTASVSGEGMEIYEPTKKGIDEQYKQGRKQRDKHRQYEMRESTEPSSSTYLESMKLDDTGMSPGSKKTVQELVKEVQDLLQLLVPDDHINEVNQKFAMLTRQVAETGLDQRGAYLRELELEHNFSRRMYQRIKDVFEENPLIVLPAIRAWELKMDLDL